MFSLHCICIVVILCFILEIGEQEEYSIAHTERWILSPKAPGAGSKEPAIDAHCKAQQCSIPLSSAHYLPILIQCPILANTTQQCPILACTLTFAGTIRWWQSKRHWALGKSECSDLPEAKINTPAPPPCATSASWESSPYNHLVRSYIVLVGRQKKKSNPKLLVVYFTFFPQTS